MPLGPDEIVARIYTILNTSSTKPTGLSVLDHDMLPTEEADLPVCGVYLVQDQKADEAEAMDGEHRRRATIRVEIRAKGAMLSGTKTIREWALKAILNDDHLNNQDLFDLDYQGFQPFGMASDTRLSGADLDFVATYLFMED